MKKILVIDYDQSSLQALQKTLTQEGFEVVLAGDGQAGWEKFQSEKPDLVLMEAMLSKIHGFELCDRITKDPVSKTPVFIMTGVYKDRVYRTEALRTYGASEYFEKPLDMPKFLASIHGLLTVPDIKPGPEAEPTNGGPTNGHERVPVVRPAPEPARRTEPPAEPRPPRPEPPRPPRPEPPRPRATTESHGGGGLSLETILNVRPQPKAKPAADAKARKDEELRLEALLNDIAVTAEERHRPEPPKHVPPVQAPLKEAEAKPQEHARKDHQAEDIDRLLKTTLADFGLEGDKKKPARPASEPAPAPMPAPEKPRQAAPVPPAPRVQAKPAPPPAPSPASPEKAKAAVPPFPPPAVQEKAKAAGPPSPTPAVAEKPRQAQPAPKPAAPPVKSKPEPKPEPRPQPAAPKAEARAHVREAEAQKSPEARIFKDIYEVEKKKSPVPFIAIGAGIVAVVAVGFLLLRPKHNPNPAGANSPTTQMPSSVPEKAPDTTLPSLSEEKLKAVNAKPNPAPQASRPVENLPGAAEAIAPPTITDISRLNAKATPEKKPEAKPAGPGPAVTKPAETKAADGQAANPQTAAQGAGQPPAGTETAAPQGTPAGASDAGAAPAAAPAPKANPGDLVPLASVDESPKIVKSVDPVYPAQAARFGKGGSVTVNALINESGAVAETGILKGLKDDMGMEKAAMDAVRKWKFQPAKKDGVNVKVWKPIVVTFRPAQTSTT